MNKKLFDLPFSMMKLVYVLVFVSVFVLSFSIQAQQTNNWYFGSAGGFPNTGIRIDFTSGAPVVSTGIPMLTEEGTSSISSATGAPLFYSDGRSVYDAVTNTTIPGGTGLQGSSSSTQSAIIMPKPGSTTQWLMFTSSANGVAGTWYYTITGTTPTGPFSVGAGTQLAAGGVVGEGLFIIGSTKVGSSFWVIARNQGGAGVVSAWDVSNAGVVTAAPVTSTLSGPAFTNTSFTSGQGTIKSNTCQNQLAFTYGNADVDITDFNTATGQVIANSAKRFSVGSQSYGIEFSSNDLYLYATSLSGSTIYKYTIASSTVVVLGSSAPQEAGQLQTAPDGKIYCAESDATIAANPTTSFLGVIDSPNAAGATYTTNALNVSYVYGGNRSFSYRGLPTFPKSLVVSNPIINPGDGTYCINTAIPLSFTFAGSIDASGVTWTHTGTGGSFTPGAATSTNLSPSITFTSAGAKTVTLSFNDACGRPYTTTRNFTIVSPLVPAGTKTCSGLNSVQLDATGSVPGDYPNYLWYDAPSGGNIVGVGNPVNLLYPNIGAVPPNFYVEVGGSVTTTSSGSNQVIASPNSFTWAANPANYTVSNINVLANRLILKSIDLRPYNGTANGVFSVTIRQGATVLATFNHNVGPSYVDGNTITVPVNLTLLQGSNYSIQLQNVSGMTGGWWGGAWAGATNANQITYPAGTGTNGVFSLVYDYQNYTTIPTCSNRVLVSGTCTLPLDWLDISAQRSSNNSVLVKWSVASQYNNQRFEVQRSTDGVNFTTVGVLPGKGTYSSYDQYEFLDYTSEKGKLYYRVVQYDYDGASSASRVVVAELSAKTLNEVILYPNPANDQFTVTLLSLSDDSGLALVQVLNSIGQVVYSSAVDASRLSSGLVVDAANFPQGAYLVKVTTNEGEWIEQLIKR